MQATMQVLCEDGCGCSADGVIAGTSIDDLLPGDAGEVNECC